MNRVGLFLGFLLFFCCGTAVAQVDDNVWNDIWEQWAEQNDNETIPDDVVEQMLYHVENPVNLNDTSSTELYDLPFVTPFQRDILRAYIQQNGHLVSLAELHLLNGFDSTTIRMMIPFVTVCPVVDGDTFSLRQLLHRGRSSLVMGVKSVFPRGRGYEENIYLGSPYRTYVRYSLKFSNRITFQLSADKDAGEPFMYGDVIRGFDYYGYHLKLDNFGIFKRTIIGKYGLQFGQGVTLWTGYSLRAAASIPLWRYGQGIRPAGAFSEYGGLCGFATTLGLNSHTEMTLFYSNVRRDATLAQLGDTADLDVLNSIYESGYHRTEFEIGKKNRLREQLAGARVQYRTDDFVMGLTTVAAWLDNPIQPADYVYNAFVFSGDRNFNGGMDFSYRYRRLLLFGEVALSLNDSTSSFCRKTEWLPYAAVFGAQFNLNAANNVSIAWHQASPIYHNMHANMIGQISSAQNETGIMACFNSHLPFGTNVQMSADLFRFPWMRYRIYSPSSGVDYRILLSKEMTPCVVLTCQYRHKVSQRNSGEELYCVEQIVRRQLQMSLDYSPNDHWRFLSRLSQVWFSCEKHQPEKGFLVFQEVNYNGGVLKHPFTLGARLSLFDVSNYDARIYMYESDMMYEYNVPMLNGRGMRFHLIYRQQITPQISMALKYAVSFYPEMDKIGSGYDVVEGNCRHEAKAQLRLNF